MFDANGDLIPPDPIEPFGGGVFYTNDHPEPEPGQTCTTCKRKVPHPKKESSPTSKTFSYRVPLDEAEAHAEILEIVEKYVGCAEQPFAQFKTLALALGLVLQDESLRGFAQRAA